MNIDFIKIFNKKKMINNKNNNNNNRFQNHDSTPIVLNNPNEENLLLPRKSTSRNVEVRDTWTLLETCVTSV